MIWTGEVPKQPPRYRREAPWWLPFAFLMAGGLFVWALIRVWDTAMGRLMP